MMEVLPAWLVYFMLATTAAVENLIPPFPGDTITVFGAYMSGLGLLDPLAVMIFTAAGNLGSNILLYYIGLAHGRDFIRQHPHLFHESLLPRVSLFYRKWGTGMIIFSRFLVGLRSMVPLFAGVIRLKPRKFFLPVGMSILVQHSLLVWLGYTLGSRWNQVKAILANVNLGLGLVAVAVLVFVIYWFKKMLGDSRARAARKKARKAKRIGEGN